MPARILVVEDDPANLSLMGYLLQAFGHSTVPARDGEEALAAAAREEIDLVICDLQLPGMDGYEVLRRLRQDPGLAAVPVVAVTAFAMVGDRERMLAAGFDAYLPKPIDPEEFVPRLEALLPEARRSRGRPSPVTER